MPYRRYGHADPRRYVMHYLTKFGRRGAILTLIGVVWIGMGVSILITPPSEIYYLISIGSWPRALVWILTGCVALWYARKPQGEDALGFLALYLMPAYRVVAYVVGMINYLIEPDLGTGGSARAIVQVLTWLTIMVLVSVIAGWSEPEPRATRDRRKAATP